MKILIIRFSSIGDVVLTTPIVRCIKHQLGAEIHFLTKSGFKPILESNPHIDQVFGLEDSFASTLQQLSEESYDYVVDLHKNLRSMRVRIRLRSSSAGFNKANLAKWLMVNAKIDLLPKQHIVDRYFEAVRALKVRYDGKGLDYFIQEQTIQEFKPPYVVFAIGGAHATKRLPKKGIAEICSKMDIQIILIGGPEDVETGSEIAGSLSHVINKAGTCSLDASAALIERAELIITHDTGMMHIAAALQRPIISIWGNTIPAFGMHPFYPEDTQIESAIFEVSNLPCRPCSKIGYAACPKKHFKCMTLQPTAAIAARAMELLDTSVK